MVLILQPYKRRVFFLQDYKDLQEKEEQKETEFPDEDPACYDQVHNGREVLH